LKALHDGGAGTKDLGARCSVKGLAITGSFDMNNTDNIPAHGTIFPVGRKPAPPINPIWLLAFGTLLLGLGPFSFFSIVTATIVSVYVVAISMVMAGAVEIGLGFQSSSTRRQLTWVLLGVLYMCAGLFAFFNPLLAAGVLTLLLGASLVAAGVVRLFIVFQMRSNRQWWWMALSAAVTTLLGLMVLSQWPASSLYILGIFLSVDLLMAGIGWVMIGTAALASHRAAIETSP
jgi:uncharacterized membrane protein HdeD (DUF308 family)